jgi:hypothetical protein
MELSGGWSLALEEDENLFLVSLASGKAGVSLGAIAA